MQSCGADSRGMRLEWRHTGGRAHLGGVTELGRMLGNDPNMALSVMYGLGMSEAGRSGDGGMDPQRRGWVKVGKEGGSSSSNNQRSSSSTSSTSSDGKPPPQGYQKEAPPLRGRRCPPPEPHPKPKA